MFFFFASVCFIFWHVISMMSISLQWAFGWSPVPIVSAVELCKTLWLKHVETQIKAETQGTKTWGPWCPQECGISKCPPCCSPGTGSGFAAGMTAILAAASWGKARRRGSWRDLLSGEPASRACLAQKARNEDYIYSTVCEGWKRGWPIWILNQ